MAPVAEKEGFAHARALPPPPPPSLMRAAPCAMLIHDDGIYEVELYFSVMLIHERLARAARERKRPRAGSGRKDVRRRDISPFALLAAAAMRCRRGSSLLRAQMRAPSPAWRARAYARFEYRPSPPHAGGKQRGRWMSLIVYTHRRVVVCSSYRPSTNTSTTAALPSCRRRRRL